MKVMMTSERFINLAKVQIKYYEKLERDVNDWCNQGVTYKQARNNIFDLDGYREDTDISDDYKDYFEFYYHNMHLCLWESEDGTYYLGDTLCILDGDSEYEEQFNNISEVKDELVYSTKKVIDKYIEIIREII